MSGKLWAVTAKNSKSRGWTSNVRRKIFLWWPTNRQLLRARLRRAAHTHLLLPWNGGVRNETRRNTEAKTSAAQEATLNSSRCRSTHETLRAHANAHWTSCLGMFGGPDARKWTRALALVSQMKRNPRHPRLVRINEKKKHGVVKQWKCGLNQAYEAARAAARKISETLESRCEQISRHVHIIRICGLNAYRLANKRSPGFRFAEISTLNAFKCQERNFFLLKKPENGWDKTDENTELSNLSVSTLAWRGFGR